MAIKTPTTFSDRALQAIKPTTLIDGAPMAVSAVSATTVSKVLGGAVYIFSNVSVHVRFTKTSLAATINNIPVPMQTPMVFACHSDDYVSVVKMAGQPDGTIWIMRLEEL